MPDPDEQRIIEFDRLNLFGKAVFLTGTVVRTTADFIDRALERAADLVIEAENAFREGRDGSVEDAKILKEWEERPPGTPVKHPH